MLGVNSFSLIDSKEDRTTKAVFNASLMREWKSVIGLSGTISESTIVSVRAELKDSICIEIPSLRKNGNNNKIPKVVEVADDSIDLFDAICKRIAEI